MRDMLDQSHHADHRSGEHRADRTLVVERHIAAGHRRAERVAGFGHAADGLAELVVHFRASRVTEVEVVGDRFRASTRAGNVARGLAYGDLGPDTWIEIDVAAVAIRFDGECPVGATNANDGGVAPRADHRVRANAGVVLAIHPGL